MNRHKLLIGIITFQLILVCLLVIKIYRQEKKVRGTSVNPISKDSLLFPKNGNYKYFYEHKPNTTQTLSSTLIDELGYPSGTEIKYTINSDGLNQISDYPVKKPDNVYRIITLGDSYTFGENVNTQDNYPSQLEKKLNENLKCKNIKSFQVLNLGMEGYDISYAVARYKLRGQKYNPDLVLWFIIDADLLRIDELQIPKTKYYDDKLKQSGEEDKLAKAGIFYQGWHQALAEIVNSLGGEDKVLNLQKQYFSEFSNYYGGPLLIFDFPPLDNKYKNTLNDFKNSRKNTILYDNLTTIYENPESFLEDGHPSPKGYTAIVDNLYNYLTKNNVIPCQKP